jgi:hypothetical protein
LSRYSRLFKNDPYPSFPPYRGTGQALFSLAEKGTLRLLLFRYLPDKVFQAIHLDLEHGGKLLAEFAFGEAFLVEPDEVGFRQIAEAAVFIFTEGHTGIGQFL